MYTLRAEILPSFILVLMGSMDCLTTVIGISYGASESNPVLTGVVNSNIAVFTMLKLAATFCIAGTYILSKRMLNRAVDKTAKSFRFGAKFVKFSYAGLVVFLIIVVTNNLLILLT